MPGFLLEDDAVEARKNIFDGWLDEQKKNAAAAAATAQQTVTDAAGAVQQRKQEFDSWLASQQPPQPAPQPAQSTSAPAPTPTMAFPQPSAPATPEAQQRAGVFDDWLNQRRQDVQNVTTAIQGAVPGAPAPPPALPHSEEPGSATDVVPGSATGPDLGSRWKTQFDFGATYTGDYRTGTPHRGVDMVPAGGSGIGTEVDAFQPGTVSNIFRDPGGAGGLIVYVQDDRGLTHAYMHLNSVAAGLQVGSKVDRGTPIATMGESGTEGSPHLHYEVRKNAASGDPLDQLIDPRPYVQGGGTAPPRTAAAPSPVQGALDVVQGASDRVRGQIDNIRQAAAATGVPQSVIAAIMDTEAGGPDSVSPSGAKGFMQLMDATAQRFGVKDPFDPAQNILGGARYLKELFDQTGAWDKAAAAYFGAFDWATKQITGARDARGTTGTGYVSRFQNALDQYGGAAATTVQRDGSDILGTLGQGAQSVAQRAADLERTSGDLARSSQEGLTSAMSQLDATRARIAAENDRYDQEQRAKRNAQLVDLMQTRRFDLPDIGSGFQAPNLSGVRSALEPLNQPPFAEGSPLRQQLDELMRPKYDLEQGRRALEKGYGVEGAGLSGEQLGILGGAQADEKIGQDNANNIVAKAKDAGWQPEPAQEDIAKLVLSQITPINIASGLIGGPDLLTVRGLAEGAAFFGLQLLGSGAGAAVAPHLPEPLRPFAPLIGGFVAPMAGPSLGRGLLRDLRQSLDDWARVGERFGAGRAGAPAPGRYQVTETGRVPSEPGIPTEPRALTAPETRALPEPARALPSPPEAPGPREPAAPTTALAVRGQEPGIAAMAVRGEPPPGVPQPGISAMAAGEAPSMGGGTTGISQTPDFLRESLRRMYPGAINKAAAKEAVQNSVDASRGITGATTHVNVDNTNKTISIVDQGKGMTPQTMEDVFVKLGGSQKPAGSSGGMGTAIKAVMANAEDTWVRTIGRDPDRPGEFTDSVMHGSGDDFLGGTMHRYYARLGEMPDSELQGAPREIVALGNGPNTTGTAIWTKPMADVNWDANTLDNWVTHFNRTSRILDQNVNFTIDGTTIKPGFRRDWVGNEVPIPEETKPTEHLATIQTPGADITFYGSPATSETGYADIKLLNNGQYQADMFIQLPGNAKMPSTLVADVHSTVDPKGVGYPWTADRNNLIDTAQQAIKNYVANDLARNIIGRENEQREPGEISRAMSRPVVQAALQRWGDVLKDPLPPELGIPGFERSFLGAPVRGHPPARPSTLEYRNEQRGLAEGQAQLVRGLDDQTVRDLGVNERGVFPWLATAHRVLEEAPGTYAIHLPSGNADTARYVAGIVGSKTGADSVAIHLPDYRAPDTAGLAYYGEPADVRAAQQALDEAGVVSLKGPTGRSLQIPLPDGEDQTDFVAALKRAGIPIETLEHYNGTNERVAKADYPSAVNQLGSRFGPSTGERSNLLAGALGVPAEGPTTGAGFTAPGGAAPPGGAPPGPGAGTAASGVSGGGVRGAVRDFLTGNESELAAIDPRLGIRLGGAAAGVAGSEATMSDEDKQDPWGRISRDLGFGLAGASAPGAAAAIVRRGGPTSWQDLRQLHVTQQPLVGAAQQRPTVAQFLSAFTKNNLLSGPGTQVSNIFSQLIELGKMPLERAAAGYEDEAIAGLKTAGQAIPDALRNAVATMRTGRGTFQPPPGTQHTAAYWFALRALGAADDFFRTLGYAMGSGMEGQRFIRENPGQTVQQVLQHNQAAIDQAGQKTARLSVFAEGNGPGQAISDLKQKLQGARAASSSLEDRGKAAAAQVAGMAVDAGVPFSSVPGRIWTAGLRRLPGVAETEALGRAGISWAKGDERGARLAIGGGLVASVINTSIISNIMNGNITGPEDKEHPTSIKINGQWVDYSRWGPYMLPIALPAAWVEAARKEGNKPDPDQVKALYNATFKTMANQFYAADLIKVMSQVGEGNAAGATGQLVGSYVDRYLPAGAALNFATQVWDPIMRDTSNKGLAQFWEREQAKIPGLAQLLPTQPSMTSGETEQRLRSGLQGTLLGVQTRQVSDIDAEVNRLEKLGYSLPNPTKAPTQVSVQGATIPLNESEQRELTYQRGQAIDKILTPLVNSAAFQGLTDDQKARAIASRLSNVDNDTARNWERMTPAAERSARIREGRTVVGRREPAVVGR